VPWQFQKWLNNPSGRCRVENDSSIGNRNPPQIHLWGHKIIKLVSGAVNSLSNLHTTNSQYGRKDFHFSLMWFNDPNTIGKKRVWVICFRKCQLCHRNGAIRKKVGRSLKHESDTSLGNQQGVTCVARNWRLNVPLF
jgi:hypothetical protein